MKVTVDRGEDRRRVQDALGHAPVVVLTGPRQAGKTTLARAVVSAPPSHWFDLENPGDQARLGEPTLTLPRLEGTVVIDEAQREPDLFPQLRVLVDSDRRPGRFLVLGSASPALTGLAAESLTGRVEQVELPGLRLDDVGEDSLHALWVRGGLPPSFLASDKASFRWRESYLRTVFERDLPGLGFRFPATTMRRFFTMLAHYHGQTWNGAALANALDVSQPSVRRYLDALTDALLIRQLQPRLANVAKRQVRAPKIYLRDSGLLHALLGIRDETALLSHPKVGASWEGMVVEQLLGRPELQWPMFWATHAGAELDLILEREGSLIGVEIKRTDRPKVTPSMRHALADLELDHVYVVHAGPSSFPLDSRIDAIALTDAIRCGLTLESGHSSSAP